MFLICSMVESLFFEVQYLASTMHLQVLPHLCGLKGFFIQVLRISVCNYRCKKLPNHHWINIMKLLLRVFYIVKLLLKL